MTSTDYQQRAELVAALQKHLSEQSGTQSVKAQALGITQPRLSDLLRNRIEKFSLDALVSLTKKAGLRVNVNAQSVLVTPSQGLRLRNLDGSPFPVPPEELGKLDGAAGP